MNNSEPPAINNEALLERWAYRDTEDFDKACAFVKRPVDAFVPPVATRGEGATELHLCVVDVHRMARESYLAMIHAVGRNIFPLIIARDTEPEMDRADLGRQGLGGTYTLLLENGEAHSVCPTPPEYEFLKCLSHMPLGLFAIVSPYFQNPRATTWVDTMRRFGEKVAAALGAFTDGAGMLPQHLMAVSREMLEHTHAYVTRTLEQRSVTPDAYETYCSSMRPLIRVAMDEAARMQVNAVTTAMLRWRTMLGPQQWRRLYVLIPTIWPVSDHSPRQQIFRSVMDPDMVDTNLLIAEGVSGQEALRDLLGRIVADRAAGRLVMGVEDARGQRMTQCLSSQTDVVSDSARKALLEFERSFCAHSEFDAQRR